ncbi:MAG: type II toxin-antitoxin system HigA family antitoxin [Bryobacteraceae bacterium]
MIDSPPEYKRSKQALERLLFPERKLSPEEDAMAKLLLHLVDLYEHRTTTPPASSPRQVLRHLMDQRHLKQADLAPVLGTVSVVSEVLNGKRQINAKQARKLADYFNVSTDVFV